MTTWEQFIYKTDGSGDILVERIFCVDKIKTKEITEEEYELLCHSAERDKDYKIEKNGYKYFVKRVMMSTSRRIY